MGNRKQVKRPKVGGKMKTWFSDRPDGYSTILGVRKYDGKYTEFFSWIVKLTAPRTSQGWAEMAI